MTTLLLIRHGDTDAVGERLVGRLPGVHLDPRGVRQSRWLARRLAELRLAAVCSSPMERTAQTAAPIAQQQGIAVELRAGLDEIDFGDWTGCTFEELAPLPSWQRFNSARSCTRIPGGEHITEVQARVVAELESIRREHPLAAVAVVTHADVIRTALAHYAGMPIDLFLRLEIAPASISAVRLERDGPRIAAVNLTESLPT